MGIARGFEGGGGFGGGFGGIGYYGGIGYMPWVGGVPFFHHKKKDDEDDPTKVDCDALADSNHPDHRDAVTTIAHVDEATHKSIMQRIHEELAKL